jgi:hypothetical protein
MRLASISAAITGLPAGAPAEDAPAAVLDLYVTELAQLFDPMDLAPLRERDLDPKTNAYIVEWAQEHPPARTLYLVVHLGHPSAGEQDAGMVGEAVHAYYAHGALAARRRLKQLFRLGRISLLIGVVFVGVAAGIGEAVVSLFTRERYATLVHESVVIGAWVALWRPMEIFLYDWWPIRAEARLLERLSKLHVRLVAMEQQGGPPS